MDWQDIATAPRDGTQILLTRVDEGIFGIRHGFYEASPADRKWYDIDGEEIVDPQYWCAVEPPPGARS